MFRHTRWCKRATGRLVHSSAPAIIPNQVRRSEGCPPARRSTDAVERLRDTTLRAPRRLRPRSYDPGTGLVYNYTSVSRGILHFQRPASLPGQACECLERWSGAKVCSEIEERG